MAESSAGTPIGPYDVLIAGQARARQLALITRNVREFARVQDLMVADWQSEPGSTLGTEPASELERKPRPHD